MTPAVTVVCRYMAKSFRTVPTILDAMLSFFVVAKVLGYCY